MNKANIKNLTIMERTIVKIHKEKLYDKSFC